MATLKKTRIHAICHVIPRHNVDLLQNRAAATRQRPSYLGSTSRKKYKSTTRNPPPYLEGETHAHYYVAKCFSLCPTTPRYIAKSRLHIAHLTCEPRGGRRIALPTPHPVTRSFLSESRHQRGLNPLLPEAKSPMLPSHPQRSRKKNHASPGIGRGHCYRHRDIMQQTRHRP
jgi:hypothetical protein